jgi:hypothetical protein
MPHVDTVNTAVYIDVDSDYIARTGGIMLKRLSQGSVPLTVTGCLMLAALAASVVGLVIDPRIITGAPAWLKPAKFAASIALYTFTLAWMFTFIPEWANTRRIVGWTTAIALVVEIVIIDVQAWRGTTSHFNVGTTFDGVLWTIMGLAIVVQTLSTVAVAIALWRQRFADRAMGWALRLGMTMTIVGAFSGGLMTQPTRAQLAAARGGQRMTIAGAHTVGSPDGGAGIPGTGWSIEHGDLRVAHFLGLHAMQALPLAVLVLRRRRFAESTRVRLTLIAGGSYVALFSILLWQALRGQSVLAPDAMTIGTLAAWTAITAAVVWMSVEWRAPVHDVVVV